MGVKNNYLRPKKLSGDNSQIKDAILHAINWLAVNQNKKFDAIMRLTNIFLNSYIIHII